MIISLTIRQPIYQIQHVGTRTIPVELKPATLEQFFEDVFANFVLSRKPLDREIYALPANLEDQFYQWLRGSAERYDQFHRRDAEQFIVFE